MDGSSNISCENVNQSEEYYDYIVESLRNQEELMREYPGVCIEEFGTKYAFLHVPKQQEADRSSQFSQMEALQFTNDTAMEEIRAIDRYGYTAIPKLFGLMDTSNMEAIGALRIQNQPVLNLRGQGVIIGFVDTGIAFDLNIFRNEDGTSRILGLWDQTIEDSDKIYSGVPPFSLSYGTPYNQEEINQALMAEDPYEVIPSRDEVGHGTFLAAIGAGKRDEANDFIGVAPDASLAVVKLKPAKQYLRDYFQILEGVIAYGETDIMNGVKYLLELSRYFRKPIIICIGLGTNQGGHDGRMPISDYLSRISDAHSVAVVQAAGNEGNARRHYFGRVGPDVVDSVEIRVDSATLGFTVELWGNSLNTFYVGFQSPSGERIEPTLYRTNEVRRYEFILDGSQVYVYDRVVKMQGGDYLVSMQFVTPSAGIWKIFVAAEGIYQTDYHMWMPITQFVNEDTYFLSSNPYTTLTSNACATNTIVAGMYNHVQNSIVSESSKGYTRINQVKPDILAPGVNVYGPDTRGGYTLKTGSSIAAAHAAGAAALIMEFGAVRGNLSYMDGLDIKTLMIRGADRRVNVEYPNETYGYGFLNVYQIFQNMIGQ